LLTATWSSGRVSAPQTPCRSFPPIRRIPLLEFDPRPPEVAEL